MIVGNASVVRLIDRAANDDKLSHAYLFYGEKGLGKKAAAVDFAKAILCHGTGRRPCGTCASCKKAEHGAHPDITVLSGTGEKNELTVANIRKLKEDAAVFPNDGEKKVYIICDCQRMQPPAANALLKLLEEPPAHLVLLLTADDRAGVLPTILSRCIPVGMFPVSEEECAHALEQLAGVDAQTAERAAKACGGNIGKGLAALKEGEESLTQTFCESLIRRDEYGMLCILSGFGSDRAAYRVFLERLLEHLRDAVVYKSGGHSFVSGSEQTAAALSGSFTTRQLQAQLEAVLHAVKSLDANANTAVLSAWLTGSFMENRSGSVI